MSEYYFYERPGFCLGNINGQLVMLDEEARRTMRTTTLSQLFGGPKDHLTQADYEEIEEFFSGNAIRIYTD